MNAQPATLAEAGSDLERAITEAKLHNDPMHGPLVALARYTAAIERAADRFEGAAAERIAELAAPQITPALYRAATVAAAVKIRTLGLIAGAVLFGVAASGLGIGYTWGAHRSDTAVLAIACSHGTILIAGGERYCAMRAP